MFRHPECIKEKEYPTLSDELRDIGFSLSGRNKEILPWGDPKVGTIVFIKMFHNDYYNSHTIEANRREYETLIRYQQEIYHELRRQKATHIFMEWVKKKDVESWAWKETIDDIKKAIKNPKNRREIFANYGWGFIYLAENPSVVLHHSESDEIKYRADEFRVQFWCISEPIQDEREEYVAEQIGDFLTSHPWQKAYLIYWAWHTFKDNFDKIYSGQRNKPIQEIIWFSKAAEALLKSQKSLK